MLEHMHLRLSLLSKQILTYLQSLQRDYCRIEQINVCNNSKQSINDHKRNI